MSSSISISRYYSENIQGTLVPNVIVIVPVCWSRQARAYWPKLNAYLLTPSIEASIEPYTGREGIKAWRYTWVSRTYLGWPGQKTTVLACRHAHTSLHVPTAPMFWRAHGDELLHDQRQDYDPFSTLASCHIINEIWGAIFFMVYVTPHSQRVSSLGTTWHYVWDNVCTTPSLLPLQYRYWIWSIYHGNSVLIPHGLEGLCLLKMSSFPLLSA